VLGFSKITTHESQIVNVEDRDAVLGRTRRLLTVGWTIEIRIVNRKS